MLAVGLFGSLPGSVKAPNFGIEMSPETDSLLPVSWSFRMPFQMTWTPLDSPVEIGVHSTVKSTTCPSSEALWYVPFIVKDDGPAVAGADVPPAPEFGHTDEDGLALPDGLGHGVRAVVADVIAALGVDEPQAESAVTTASVASGHHTSARMCHAILTVSEYGDRAL